MRTKKKIRKIKKETKSSLSSKKHKKNIIQKIRLMNYLLIINWDIKFAN